MRLSLPVLFLSLFAGAALAGEVRVEVKHRSAATVYLSGGSASGLAVGDRLEVLSKGVPIGEIEVIYLAEHSASCKILSETRPVQAGDAAVARKLDAAPEPAPEPEIVESENATALTPTDLPSASGSSDPPPWARARGGASFLWTKAWDETPTNFDFEQRNLRLDLGMWDIAGHPLQFNARLRGRQDLRSRPPGFAGTPTSERRDRLYELAARYDRRDGRLSLEAGRIGVSSLGVGYLDGASVDLRLFRSLRAGGFYGRRADVERSEGLEGGDKYGAFVRLAGGGPSWPGSYDAQAFAVRELAGAEPSREYVGFQGRFGSGGFTFTQWAELDLLRGWRAPDDGSSTQLSNLSLAMSYRFTPGVSVAASYDQRRNYRTAETRSVPEVLFDDFMRQGFRGSVDLSRSGGFGASAFVGVRLADDQTRRDAYSFGGGLRHARLFGGLAGSLDGSGFSNGTTSGYQGSARLGRVAGPFNADLAWGFSSYRLSAGGEARRFNQWLRLSARRELSHGFFVYAEGEYDKGDDVEGPRAALELGYRF